MPTKDEKDMFAAEDTTGHSWDGIAEFNNPLPRWWLWIFYACIVWSVGYWIVYPSWPLVQGYLPGVLHQSDRRDLANSIAAAKESQSVYLSKIAATDVGDIEGNKELFDFAAAGGRSAFGLNCSQCHGSGAAGSKGYPNLVDDDWLWGGTIDDIYQTIRFGIRSGNDQARSNDMPAFLSDEILTKAQINDVAEYVLSLSNSGSDAAAAARGKPLFADNCAACHGEDGKGNQELGAPRLTDGIWLYGGDKATVVQTISFARRGVMPAWEGKLDPVTIKELAVYVHSLGGGE